MAPFYNGCLVTDIIPEKGGQCSFYLQPPINQGLGTKNQVGFDTTKRLTEVVDMEKLRVYLDTSVISHLLQKDVPEKMADTRQLWEMFRTGKYDVYLSTVTLEELKGCSEPKQSQLFDYLGLIDYTLVQIDDNVADIAQQIIEMGILTKKSYDDCQHIGAAIVSECDCIMSWNFKHIVNIKTIRGVRAITNLNGHKPIEILNPSVLLESEE